jgi:hypothetical protein
MTLPRPIRSTLEFFAALAFLLTLSLMGVGVLWLAGTAINTYAADPEAHPWAWAAGTALALAAMGYGGRALHRLISRALRYSTMREKSGARSGVA